MFQTPAGGELTFGYITTQISTFDEGRQPAALTRGGLNLTCSALQSLQAAD